MINMLIVGNESEDIKEIKQCLKLIFDMKNMDEV